MSKLLNCGMILKWLLRIIDCDLCGDCESIVDSLWIIVVLPY